LRWALSDAEARDGELTAVFAWQVPFISFPGAYDKDELEQAGKEFIVDVVSRVAPTPPIPLLTIVSEGDPAASLIEASKGANLLVVGTRGRSPWSGLLLGSVSQRCAAAAECPVVLVKLPRDQAEHIPVEFD
jgi:nucleotide-binding universal stress UspA family protein